VVVAHLRSELQAGSASGLRRGTSAYRGDLGSIGIYSVKYSTRIGTPALKGFAHSDLEVPKGQQSVTTMARLPSKMAITSCGEDNFTPGFRHLTQVLLPVSRRPTVAVHSSLLCRKVIE
jgi:hypothetical protein